MINILDAMSVESRPSLGKESIDILADILADVKADTLVDGKVFILFNIISLKGYAK